MQTVLVIFQGSKNVTDWWLSYWISHSSATDISNATSSNVTFYLEVYGGLAAGNTFFTLFRAFLFAYGGICAAACIHDKLLDAVSRVSDMLVVYNCLHNKHTTPT